MDQIKKIIAGAQKHAFWIVSALTVLLGIVGYSISRSTMSAVFKAQATKIDSQYSALSTISNEVSTHPNSKTHAQMDKQIAALSEDVQRAWVKQYERQAEILKWPVGPIPEKFIAKVEKLRPIELALEFPPADRTDPLVVNDRVQYAKYINEQFPVLAKIIGTEWVGTPAVSGSAGGYGGGMGGGSMMAGSGMMGGGSMMGGGASGEYGSAPGGEGMAGGMLGSGGMPGMGMAAANRNADLVIWSKASQDAVLADVQTWRSKYPSTHDVLYTQENIWILKGLLEIIAKVNAQANAVANFQATVKEIEFLRIGRAAVGKVGTVDRPGDGNAAGGMGSSMGIGIGMGSEGLDATAEGGGGSDSGSMASGANIADGSGEDSGATGMVMATPDPANGRYVDAAYAPLTGDDLRAKMKSSSPEDAYFAVAKRVPVRMRLKVDQRKIQTLVAELGNANLLFEIRQIRIGDTTPAPAAGAGGGYGMDPFGGSGGGPSMGGGMMGGGMMGGGMMGGGMMGGSGMPGMGMAAPGKIWDIPVEIYGVVYLFNPPDAEKLGLNDVTAETEVADKVEISADVVQANEAQQGNVGDASTDAAGNNATTVPGGTAPDGSAPNGNAPGAGIPNGGVPGAPGGNVPGGNVPGVNVPGGNVPGVNVPGGNVPGGNVPGGNVPVTGVPTGGVPAAIGGNVPAAAGGVNPAAAGGGVPSANVPVN